MGASRVRDSLARSVSTVSMNSEPQHQPIGSRLDDQIGHGDGVRELALDRHVAQHAHRIRTLGLEVGSHPFECDAEYRVGVSRPCEHLADAVSHQPGTDHGDGQRFSHRLLQSLERSLACGAVTAGRGSGRQFARCVFPAGGGHH